MQTDCVEWSDSQLFRECAEYKCKVEAESRYLPDVFRSEWHTLVLFNYPMPLYLPDRYRVVANEYRGLLNELCRRKMVIESYLKDLEELPNSGYVKLQRQLAKRCTLSPRPTCTFLLF